MMRLAAGLFALEMAFGQHPQPAPQNNKSPRFTGCSSLKSEPVFAPQPEVPRMAKIARVRGKVVMQAVVGKDGQVASLNILSGHPFLINSAMDAAKKYRYVPPVCDGVPVELITLIAVEFRTEIDPVQPIPLR